MRSAIDLCRPLDGIALAIEMAAREVLRAEGAAMSDAEVGALVEDLSREPDAVGQVSPG